MAETVTITLSVTGTPPDPDIVAYVAELARQSYQRRTVNGSGTVTVADAEAHDLTDDPFAGVAPVLTADVESFDVEWEAPNAEPDAFLVVAHNNDTVTPDEARYVAGDVLSRTIAPAIALDEHSVTVYAIYGTRVVASATDTVTPTA